MRFFRLGKNFNWKYIIGEILLIFIGINLAIWFNDWNTSRNAREQKSVAIAKIKEEVESNLEELQFTEEKNDLVLEAFATYKKYYTDTPSEAVALPHEMAELQKKYPRFFRITDSAEVGDGIYKYQGGTFIQLELPELTEIAWETTRSTNIAREFDYECLYGLEGVYLLQRRVQKELDKAAEALKQRKLREIISILEFEKQISEQLLSDYQEVLDNIDACR